MDPWIELEEILDWWEELHSHSERVDALEFPMCKQRFTFYVERGFAMMDHYLGCWTAFREYEASE